MTMTISRRARAMFEEERRRQGKPGLGVQISFVYGCGGAGFRASFTDEPHGFETVEDVDGIRIYLDAQSRDTLQGAAIDWEEGSQGGFVLRHPEAVLVDFC
jgi:Fe-S cluster assembly iron-binding protein IscA